MRGLSFASKADNLDRSFGLVVVCLKLKRIWENTKYLGDLRADYVLKKRRLEFESLKMGAK